MEKKPKYPRINFKIGFCSSEDSDCPATELLLQSPQCKGWQSSRYCSYPQVVLLQLPSLFMVRQITVLSHQYKIPSRVEVDYKLENQSDFKRLGHFSMGNNAESNFQVRQLKNIPVTITTSAIRFTLHKNHINKFNVFNQVGLISVCFYGEPEASIRNVNIERPNIKSIESVDKSSLKMIQQLEEQKKQAVENQDYEKAGRIKLKIDEIKRVSTQLDDLQERKKLAVSRQDYETARTIHEEIKRIKERFQRQDSLKPPQNDAPSNQYKQPPARVRNQHPPQQYQQDNEYKPPIKKPPQTKSSKQAEEAPQQSKKHLNVDDIPINVKNQNPYEDAGGDQQQEPAQNAPKKLQPLKGDHLKLCEQYFNVVDQEIFMMIFSKHHAFREEGVERVREIIDNPGASDKNTLARAVFLIVKITLDDKIANVLIRSQQLLEFTLKKLKPKFNDNNINSILCKIADFQGHTNQKVRLNSWDIMKQLPNYQITNKDVCIQALARPEGKKSPKILAGRLEALRNIARDFGSENNLQDCATFAIKNIQDKNNQVRNAAIQLIRTLIDEVGYQRVSPYLKNVRPAILKLFEEQREQMPSNREQIPIARKTQSKRMEEDSQSQKGSTKAIKKQQQYQVDSCPYCQKRDPQFSSQDYRDIHLYNTCPMLMLCQCQQAIEVSSLSAHLTSECKNSKYYKKCPRCKQAVHQGKYKAHVQAKDCNSAKPLAVANRCPLCHQDISPGVGGWKEHLVDEGCPNNSR